MEKEQLDYCTENLNTWAEIIHDHNTKAGWWDEIYQQPSNIRFNIYAAKIALIHSEVSEMLEGLRKGKRDSKLPHRTEEEVEAADIFIRLLDYCGARNLDIDAAVREKFEYNSRRIDHTKEHRQASGGKKF